MKYFLNNKSRPGTVLLLFSVLSSLFILIGVSLCINTASDTNITIKEKERSKLEFAAASGLNRAKAKIETYYSEVLTKLKPDIVFEGTEEDDTDVAPAQKLFTDEAFTSGANVDYYSYDVENEDSDTIHIDYSIYLEDDSDWTDYSSYTSKKFKVEAVAYSDSDAWVGMEEDVYVIRKSLCSYQIFFKDELEILPGPNFTLTGDIHTNSDMYLNAGNTLTIQADKVTSSGDIYRGRLDKDAVGGTVKISSVDKDGSLVNFDAGDDSTAEDWVDIASSNWQGTVKDSSLGQAEIDVPNLESFEPDGYYADEADLKIVVNVDSSGNTTYDITANGLSVSNASLNNALSETKFYDNREFKSNEKKSKITQIDMHALKDSGYYPDNGLIYMTRNDAVAGSDGDSSRVPNGFKIFNGDHDPTDSSKYVPTVLPAPTSFVSDLPVYVQGDFNLHTSSNPDTDSWQPCGVIADSVTVLSNKWEDSKNDSSSDGLRSAASTEYNFAMISGNVGTEPGKYSGGFENFPRMLESWSGKTLTMKGSFIQLYRSKYATGLWQYGKYYKAPTRNWSYEERFRNLNELPPKFVDMFPSSSNGVVRQNTSLISKTNSLIYEE